MTCGDTSGKRPVDAAADAIDAAADAIDACFAGAPLNYQYASTPCEPATVDAFTQSYMRLAWTPLHHYM